MLFRASSSFPFTSMADIVGLIASTLQLVDTVVKAREYIKDFHNAPKDQKELLLEIQNLRPLLLELRTRFDASDSTGIQHIRDSLEKVNNMINALSRKLDTAGFSKVSSRMAWPLWGKKEVEEGLKTIERFKTLLSAWLGIDIWDAQEKNKNILLQTIQQSATEQRGDHHNLLSSVNQVAVQQEQAHGILESVNDTARSQEQYLDRKRRDEIIDWLSPINFFTRQADIFAVRQPGSGEWLLQSDQFKFWSASVGKILWCPGIPGAGKTVLVSVVVDHLRETLAQGENIGVAAIYLNHKETEVQTPSNLHASIWRQIVFRKPVSLAVQQLYEKHCEPRTRPSLEKVHEVLVSTVTEYSKVYLIVDALDEYPENERNILLNNLSNLGQTVNLMLTSRPHINIHTTFESVQTLEIRATARDVQTYVDEQITKSFRLSKHIQSRPDLREEIETQIVGRSDGMFLLAKLHIISLTTKHTVKAVREALANMPSDLQNTYDEVMSRIIRQNDEDRKLALSTLSWISNAKRLLRVPELREALAVEPGTTALDPDNLLDMDIVLSVCAGLITVDQANGLVRLVHYTTQQYLERVQTTHFPSAQTDITAACITYLSFTTFPHRIKYIYSLKDTHPLFHYALEYGLVHARGQPEFDLKDILLEFLAKATRWIYTSDYQSTNFKTFGMRVTTTRLWLTAFFNLHETAQHLISIHEPLDGGALQTAMVKGDQKMIQLFIENGADTDGLPALHVASYFGYEAAVSLLLTQGADINGRGVTYAPYVYGAGYATALEAASAEGHEAVVRLLVENGADINVTGGFSRTGGSALQAAAARGHEKIVRLLIAAGADVDIQAEDKGTALYQAVESGHKTVVLFLIEHGADVNIRGGLYGTALITAIRCGHSQLVRLLVENGADVNAHADDGTALYWASYNGHLESACLLIQHSAEIDVAGGEYHTALGAASAKQHPDLVRLLLEARADVNGKGLGERDRAPLHLACSRKHVSSPAQEEVVSLLIEHGAEVDMLGGMGGRGTTALQLASGWGHEAVVRLLITNGADVNLQGGYYGTALRAASAKGHVGVARILLQKGADVNAESIGWDGETRTALEEVYFQGEDEMVALFMKHGARSDSTD
ncbi:ankyrin repeat-containing domain protein [Mycena rosella]|uniref:Ankyrin repeat-containing domain protein n=1 Tax=Mycena rosella TaxID=1033263 RepID=A0AAD7GWD5_MYCRO|nr:ankyrin repeat-containing domain protein [Mycena rosella]